MLGLLGKVKKKGTHGDDINLNPEFTRRTSSVNIDTDVGKEIERSLSFEKAVADSFSNIDDEIEGSPKPSRQQRRSTSRRLFPSLFSADESRESEGITVPSHKDASDVNVTNFIEELEKNSDRPSATGGEVEETTPSIIREIGSTLKGRDREEESKAHDNKGNKSEKQGAKSRPSIPDHIFTTTTPFPDIPADMTIGSISGIHANSDYVQSSVDTSNSAVSTKLEEAMKGGDLMTLDAAIHAAENAGLGNPFSADHDLFVRALDLLKAIHGDKVDDEETTTEVTNNMHSSECKITSDLENSMGGEEKIEDDKEGEQEEKSGAADETLDVNEEDTNDKKEAVHTSDVSYSRKDIGGGIFLRKTVHTNPTYYEFEIEMTNFHNVIYKVFYILLDFIFYIKTSLLTYIIF